MNTSTSLVHHLKDYRVPDFLIDSVFLHFDLGKEETIVTAVLSVRRHPQSADSNAPLVLDGEALALRAIKLDGHTLSPERYTVDEEKLTITDLPQHFILETMVMIQPQHNTQLSGLYCSRGNFCTQCEAHGFRRITYYLDRPDVMARFTTTISADRARYPILLSNGNLIETRELADGRHWVHWEDPTPKPSYLFALVAGDFDLLQDTFITCSGKTVSLRLYLEKGHADQGGYALQALKQAMRWDEYRFGREYDLNIYMIVAVSDFNMGAMENKGLNIFNTKYILAKPETATDLDYANVLRVIGHEYFHNWSGNRVTCRDWFQITLKEGLTVFREQSFMSDETSPALTQIEEVNLIRNRQFLEDSGPNAHPIRPESYLEVNNFYTVTVYHKGAAVIGMLHTLLGEQTFRHGMDLYFSRYDGQAVTTDDFVEAMSEVSGRDFTPFKRWYSQAGTPVLEITGDYQPAAQTFTLTVKQSCPPTPGQPEKAPFHLPLVVGLVDSQGQDMPLHGFEPTESNRPTTSAVLEVTAAENSFTFTQIKQKPIPSLLRNFSAPVKLQYPYTDEELAHLLQYDSDPVARWDAGQQWMTRLLLQAIDQWEVSNADSIEVPTTLITTLSQLLSRHIEDYHLASRLLTLPSELYLGQQRQPVPVDAIHQVREAFKTQIGIQLAASLHQHYQQLHQPEPSYQFDTEKMGRRSFKHTALAYLVASQNPHYAELAYQHFVFSHHMTDTMGALVALNDAVSPRRQQALDEFYRGSYQEALLVNKWLLLHATSALPTTIETVHSLLQHPAFSLKNPNNVYALLGGFTQNRPHFHEKDGRGYQLLADCILTIDTFNPQVAARMVEPLTYWFWFDQARQPLMREQLQRILQAQLISKDVFELVSKSLDYQL